MNEEEIRRYWQFEIPSTNLFVVEENYDNQPILKFGEYLSDMQCGDTDTKLYITDLKYVKQLQQENKKYKEVIDKTIENEEEIMYLANKVAITTQNVEIKAVRDRLEEIFKRLKGDSNE